MSILAELKNEAVWREFAAYKREKAHLDQREQAELEAFIQAEAYLPLAEHILSGGSFAYPEKKLVNKMGSEKKRVVYSFRREETLLLKLIAYLLYRYDAAQPEGCYSFRRGYGAHRAIRSLAATPGIQSMWCYKLDIHDYFNSIHIPTLLPILAGVLWDDAPLLAFLQDLLQADKAYFEGALIEEKRGVMAGTPISPFLANLYLGELDRHFTGRGLPYARYSDDVILFAPTRVALAACRTEALAIIARLGLSVNEEKESIVEPGEAWAFLGIAYRDGEIDLSHATREKLKGKIRRKARALRRWMLRKDAEPERAMRAMIRAFNNKFFEGGGANELTWARWFFPLLTRADGLREMDAYLQQYIRYIPTGRHSRANFRVDYALLKRYGYRSLVHEYYAFLER